LRPACRARPSARAFRSNEYHPTAPPGKRGDATRRGDGHSQIGTGSDARPAPQFFTSPPSTTRFCPVTERDHGEAKNSAASANSAGLVTLRSGVLAAMRSKTLSGVAEEASVVRSNPPDSMLTVMLCGPKSFDKVLVSDNSAAFAA